MNPTTLYLTKQEDTYLRSKGYKFVSFMRQAIIAEQKGKWKYNYLFKVEK